MKDHGNGNGNGNGVFALKKEWVNVDIASAGHIKREEFDSELHPDLHSIDDHALHGSLSALWMVITIYRINVGNYSLVD